MTFDLNIIKLSLAIYQLKGYLLRYKMAQFYLAQTLVVIVMVNCVETGSRKFAEKFSFWLVVTQKPYHV